MTGTVTAPPMFELRRTSPARPSTPVATVAATARISARTVRYLAITRLEPGAASRRLQRSGLRRRLLKDEVERHPALHVRLGCAVDDDVGHAAGVRHRIGSDRDRARCDVAAGRDRVPAVEGGQALLAVEGRGGGGRSGRVVLG